jgi:hypothetical protein
MLRFAWIATFIGLAVAPAMAQTAFPDVRGVWKGDSESIILGGGNPHHAAGQPNVPELRSLPFTLTVDQQDGRRFSGTFASPRNSEQVIAVISRDGTIYLADDEGYTRGTLLAPDRMELCFLYVSVPARVASCTELVKQP